LVPFWYSLVLFWYYSCPEFGNPTIHLGVIGQRCSQSYARPRIKLRSLDKRDAGWGLCRTGITVLLCNGEHNRNVRLSSVKDVSLAGSKGDARLAAALSLDTLPMRSRFGIRLALCRHFSAPITLLIRPLLPPSSAKIQGLLSAISVLHRIVAFVHNLIS